MRRPYLGLRTDVTHNRKWVLLKVFGNAPLMVCSITFRGLSGLL